MEGGRSGMEVKRSECDACCVSGEGVSSESGGQQSLTTDNQLPQAAHTLGKAGGDQKAAIVLLIEVWAEVCVCVCYLSHPPMLAASSNSAVSATLCCFTASSGWQQLPDGHHIHLAHLH